MAQIIKENEEVKNKFNENFQKILNDSNLSPEGKLLKLQKLSIK